MAQRMSNTMNLIYVTVMIINSYVLLFSDIPFLYRIVIIAFSFALLFLLSLAFQSIERIERRGSV